MSDSDRGSVDDKERGPDLERVLEEVARRERELLEVEEEILDVRRQLEGQGRSQLIKRGDPTLIAAQEAYRTKLRQTLVRKEKKLTGLSEELSRARERAELLGFESQD